MATRNQTRPSCARVKVEVDLLEEFPKRIKIGLKKKDGDMTEKWIKIKYDYVPKYCKTCMIQGHNEKQCYVITLNYRRKKKTRMKKITKRRNPKQRKLMCTRRI
ncbi:hypothetical protein H5410_060408 [Solanum commersonii]|uniref:Uncharacterized protein n=1 Tax=Solanum commersonii TaxID=4109 RepID=A0A9J5W547_SOLCO|nr:hypothetical protein H5410_060408 [Solanum commersonii]